MSNQMKLYQIIANLISLKDSVDAFYYDSEQVHSDDFYECKEYFNNALDTLLKYMPRISD